MVASWISSKVAMNDFPSVGLSEAYPEPKGLSFPARYNNHEYVTLRHENYLSLYNA